jgi:ABC-type antimicrobial peptide transport system permease subunit
MEQVLSNSIAPRRFSTVLFGALAGLGLLLALVGIYGVITYGVSQRTREIGIRMALGAARRDVLSLVLSQGIKLFLIGAAAGTALALMLTPVMSGLLFGVSAGDPLTFIVCAVFLGLVAVFASYLPARRAASVDPMVALRYE